MAICLSVWWSVRDWMDPPPHLKGAMSFLTHMGIRFVPSKVASSRAPHVDKTGNLLYEAV